MKKLGDCKLNQLIVDANVSRNTWAEVQVAQEYMVIDVSSPAKQVLTVTYSPIDKNASLDMFINSITPELIFEDVINNWGLTLTFETVQNRNAFVSANFVKETVIQTPIIVNS